MFLFGSDVLSVVFHQRRPHELIFPCTPLKDPPTFTSFPVCLSAFTHVDSFVCLPSFPSVLPPFVPPSLDRPPVRPSVRSVLFTESYCFKVWTFSVRQWNIKEGENIVGTVTLPIRKWFVRVSDHCTFEYSFSQGTDSISH